MALVSRSKRSENCAADTLIATSRFSRGSLARYTSPMPPLPTRARISYGPSLSPIESGILDSAQFNRSRSRLLLDDGASGQNFANWGRGDNFQLGDHPSQSPRHLDLNRLAILI